MSNVPLPRPGSLGLIQYAGTDMLEYAAAVSAADNARLREALDEAVKALTVDAGGKRVYPESRLKALVLIEALKGASHE